MTTQTPAPADLTTLARKELEELCTAATFRDSDPALRTRCLQELERRNLAEFGEAAPFSPSD